MRISGPQHVGPWLPTVEPVLQLLSSCSVYEETLGEFGLKKQNIRESREKIS